MKDRKKVLVLPLLSLMLLAGCQNTPSAATTPIDTGKDTGEKDTTPVEDTTPVAPATKYTVTFDLNYDGGKDFTVEVEENGTLVRPENPTREKFAFTGWFTDEKTTTAYDFDSVVSKDFTLYAGWVDMSNSITATFYWNYEGADPEVYQTVHFEKGGRIGSLPADPTREGYSFSGWYLDKDCTEEFNQMTRFDENVSVYAYWRQMQTFEAEYTQLTGLDPNTDDTCDTQGNKLGQGYSGNVSGTGLINAEKNSGINASNGYYVSSLYYPGAYLEFVIESDADASATLKLRLTAEYYNIDLSDEDFQVLVNGTKLSYSEIHFTGVVEDMTSEKKRPFTDYYINECNLKKGENVIRLSVENEDSPQTGAGSMDAKAPAVDCLYLISDANLTWDPYTENIQ